MNSTKNYDQFKFVNGNRNINSTHLKNLKQSIQKRNLLSSCPMLVTENFEIIDGQHRLMAAKELGVDIYYISLLVENKEDLIVLTQLLNANLKPWTTHDYLQSYLELGYEDYGILDAFIKDYGVPIGLAIRYLETEEGYPSTSDPKKYGLQRFKEGEFKVANYQNAVKYVEQARDFIPYLDDKGIWIDRHFVGALKVASNYVNHKRLLEKMRVWRRPMVRRATTVQYVRDIEEIYNFRNIKKIRFYEEIEEPTPHVESED